MVSECDGDDKGDDDGEDDGGGDGDDDGDGDDGDGDDIDGWRYKGIVFTAEEIAQQETDILATRY